MELDMPLVTKCFGVFPPKYATYLISIFGMSSGGVGLAGLVLYSIAENSIMRHFGAPTKVDEDIKKLVLMCVGLISLLLVVANVSLFIGVTFSAAGPVVAGYIVIITACSLLLVVLICLPISCFFISQTCLIKKVSTTATVFLFLLATLFLNVWFYFAVVIWNYSKEV